MRSMMVVVTAVLLAGCAGKLFGNPGSAQGVKSSPARAA